ncbi:zinc finger protein DHHC domain containing protein, putative [Entamoeba invadens IP1]|uniref:zinc finger protein DHHC domain containing protein, putative n=1 Tax=Entamoeba invadens IP1 TaxID=370355 RepID=UPI0002C3F454|nr:zinc finger protein DHHC domain containing protein, putative [Entamoeba invadens IP1]ELP94145.1 zinc finger protein DHHC domain containing protein, putative [Entamoeba invadens IP1]|eukprot:XP_004260916.1 zinc finger protein DHHC domain containing protein, putative [Entamoeba invadens IP1]
MINPYYYDSPQKVSTNQHQEDSWEETKKDLMKGPYLLKRKTGGPEEDESSDRVMMIVAITLISVAFLSTLYAFFHLPLVFFLTTPIPLFTFACLVFAYYKAVTTDPGRCVGYNPNKSEEDKKAAIERETFGKEKGFKIVDIGYPVRYCTTCQGFRCERAYHCKKCGSCIKKRDHCPWISQCVGENNLRYFVQFLMLVPLNCLFGVLIQIGYIIKMLAGFGKGEYSADVFFMIIAVVITIIMFSMGFAVATLMVNHVGMVLENTTSMEEIEKTRYDYLTHDKAPFFPSYSTTKYRNWKEVMGGNVLVWLIPFFANPNSTESKNTVDVLVDDQNVEVNIQNE